MAYTALVNARNGDFTLYDSLGYTKDMPHDELLVCILHTRK